MIELYIGLVIWLCFCGFVSYKIQKPRINNLSKSASNDDGETCQYFMTTYDKLFMILFFSVCILIMGLRNYTVGVDTQQYMRVYDLCSSMSFLDIYEGRTNLAMETLYLLLMKCSSLLSDNYYFFQFCITAIYCIGMARFLIKKVNDFFFGAALFLGLDLYLSAFNLQRQMLAVMLVINGREYVNNRKFVKGAVLCGIAVFIHRTAIIFIFFNIIYLIRNNPKLLRFAAVIFVFVAINYQKVMAWFQVYMPSYKNYYSNHKTLHTAGAIWIIWGIIILVSVIMLLSKERFSGDDKIIAIYSVGYIIFNIIGFYLNYAERIGLYFLPYCILLFINFSRVFKSNLYIRFYKAGVCISFLAYFLLTSMSTQYNYQFFF